MARELRPQVILLQSPGLQRAAKNPFGAAILGNASPVPSLTAPRNDCTRSASTRVTANTLYWYLIPWSGSVA